MARPSAHRSPCCWKTRTGKTGRNRCRSKKALRRSTRASLRRVRAMLTWQARSNTTFLKHVMCWSGHRRGNRRREFGIEVLSHVIAVGKATLENAEVEWKNLQQLHAKEEVILNCADPKAEER